MSRAEYYSKLFGCSAFDDCMPNVKGSGQPRTLSYLSLQGVRVQRSEYTDQSSWFGIHGERPATKMEHEKPRKVDKQQSSLEAKVLPLCTAKESGVSTKHSWPTVWRSPFVPPWHRFHTSGPECCATSLPDVRFTGLASCLSASCLQTWKIKHGLSN